MKIALKLILFCSLSLLQLIAHSTPYKGDTLNPEEIKQVISWLPRIEKDLKECEYIRQRAGYLQNALSLKDKLLVGTEQRATEAEAQMILLKADLSRQKKRKRIWAGVALGGAVYLFRNQLKALLIK